MNNTPKYILIHCTAYSRQLMPDQFIACNGWHKDRDFTLSSLGYYVGYHRLITGDKNYLARLDTDVGCHCNQGIDVNGNAIQNPAAGASMNFQSLGVCVGFDGDKEFPTAIEYDLLQKQIWSWQDKYKIPNEKVYFHRHFALNKTCPGSLITDQWLKDLLTRPLPPVPPPASAPSACIEEKQQISDLAAKVSWYQDFLAKIIALFTNKNPMVYLGNRRFGAFSSSEDPEQLAARVKAAILGSSTIIIWAIGHVVHVQLNPDDMVSFATDASALVTAIWFVYGLLKKWSIWAIDKWNARNA